MAKQILGDIDLIAQKFNTTISRLERARQLYDANHIEIAEIALDEACGSGERAMAALRNTIGKYYYPNRDLTYIKKRAAKEMEITCAILDPGYFHLSMPWLIPKKNHGTTSYLAGPLYDSLEQFRKKHQEYKMREGKQVLMYVTVFGPEIPTQRLTDVDNFEVDFITDAITMSFLPDDNPNFLGQYLHWGMRGKTTAFHAVLLSESDFFRKAEDILKTLSEI